jgi:hypothetical protein
MVLRLELPAALSWNSWIERLAHKRFRSTRLYKLTEYYGTLEASDFLGIPETSVFNYVRNSRVVHGLELSDGSLLVHPETVIRHLAANAQASIKKELKSTTIPRLHV